MGVTEDSFGFREDDMDFVCENVCYVMLEDTCLNQDRYSNNNESEVVTRLALKYGTVFQEDENEIIEQLIIFIYKKEKEQLK